MAYINYERLNAALFLYKKSPLPNGSGGEITMSDYLTVTVKVTSTALPSGVVLSQVSTIS